MNTAENRSAESIAAALARIPPVGVSAYSRSLKTVAPEIGVPPNDVLGFIGARRVVNDWVITFDAESEMVRWRCDMPIKPTEVYPALKISLKILNAAKTAKGVTPTKPVTTAKSPVTVTPTPTPAAVVRPTTAAPVRTSPPPTPVPPTPTVSTRSAPAKSTSDQDIATKRRTEEQQRQFRSHGVRWQNR